MGESNGSVHWVVILAVAVVGCLVFLAWAWLGHWVYSQLAVALNWPALPFQVFLWSCVWLVGLCNVAAWRR